MTVRDARIAKNSSLRENPQDSRGNLSGRLYAFGESRTCNESTFIRFFVIDSFIFLIQLFIDSVLEHLFSLLFRFVRFGWLLHFARKSCGLPRIYALRVDSRNDGIFGFRFAQNCQICERFTQEQIERAFILCRLYKSYTAHYSFAHFAKHLSRNLGYLPRFYLVLVWKSLCLNPSESRAYPKKHLYFSSSQ